MKHIVLYLIFTFALTYLSHGSLAFLTNRNIVEFQSVIGQSLFILGGSSPTIFGIVYIIKTPKIKGASYFKASLISFRHSYRFWIFAVVTPMLLAGTYILLRYMITSQPMDTSVPVYFYVFILFSSIIFGGIEEIGWRGYLQENLSQKLKLLPTALIIGVVWGLWHIPLFFIEDVAHYTFHFIPFMLGAIMFSTYLTWLYAKTKSLLLVILFHASINASATIGFRFAFNNDLLIYIVLTGLTFIGILLLLWEQKQATEL